MQVSNLQQNNFAPRKQKMSHFKEINKRIMNYFPAGWQGNFWGKFPLAIGLLFPGK